MRRSVIRVDQPASRTPHSFSTASKFWAWVSQPRPLVPSTEESVTSTNGTPRSTSRRASRQPWPNGLRP